MKIQFDGMGLGDTDEYASRIATFRPEYRHLGPEIVRAVNAHEELVATLKAINLRDVDFKTRERVSQAIAKAEGK